MEKGSSSKSVHGGHAIPPQSFFPYAFPTVRESSAMLAKGSSSNSGHVGVQQTTPESFLPYAFPTGPAVQPFVWPHLFQHGYSNVGSGALQQPYVWPNLFTHAYNGQNDYNMNASYSGISGGFSELLMSAQYGSLSIEVPTAGKVDCDEGYLGGEENEHDDQEESAEDTCGEFFVGDQEDHSFEGNQEDHSLEHHEDHEDNSFEGNHEDHSFEGNHEVDECDGFGEECAQDTDVEERAANIGAVSDAEVPEMRDSTDDDEDISSETSGDDEEITIEMDLSQEFYVNKEQDGVPYKKRKRVQKSVKRPNCSQ